MVSKILFQEQQKFTQWWLWLILASSSIYVIFNFINDIKITYIEENNKYNGFIKSISERNIESGSIIPIVIFLLIVILFLVLKLSTIITQETLTIRYFPFFSKTWKWDDIQTAAIINYGFVGYGIRISLKYGTVYNIKGNEGLAVTLINGRKYIIGTQNPEELKRIVSAIKNE